MIASFIKSEIFLKLKAAGGVDLKAAEGSANGEKQIVTGVIWPELLRGTFGITKEWKVMVGVRGQEQDGHKPDSNTCIDEERDAISKVSTQLSSQFTFDF